MMRLHAGLPPDEFEPTAGWQPLREPSSREVSRASMPIALALFAAAVVAWHLLAVSVVDALHVRSAGAAMEMLLGFMVLLLVHEAVHAGVHPRFGCSGSSVFGVSWRPLLLYASYQAAMSRNRFAGVLLAPLLVLSVLPMLAHATGALPGPWTGAVAAASAVNAALSGIDVLGAVLVLRQVPATGEVRNKGWQTYWRADAQSDGVNNPIG